MKKAKLILAGIACMAVVGGAYAIKANRITKFIYVDTTTAPGLCTIVKSPATTTNVGTITYGVRLLATGACTTTTFTKVTAD